MVSDSAKMEYLLHWMLLPKALEGMKDWEECD